jgi:hypothetical protein
VKKKTHTHTLEEMNKLFDLNEDVVDVLQEKLDSILECRNMSIGEEAPQMSIVDVDCDWGSHSHQLLTVNICNELMKAWALFDLSVQFDKVVTSIDEVILAATT